jgi:hypothetical protein
MLTVVLMEWLKWQSLCSKDEALSLSPSATKKKKKPKQTNKKIHRKKGEQGVSKVVLHRD